MCDRWPYDRAWALVLLCLAQLAAAVPASANVPAAADPTRPLRAGPEPSAPAAARRPTLESVLIGPTRRVAVIDGQRLREGEMKGGLKVWRILPEGVEVSVNGAERLLLVFPRNGVRKSPSRNAESLNGHKERP